MPGKTISNAILGPFQDLRRFVAGAVGGPPPTRRMGAADLAAARAVLAAAGCELAGCTQENLHTSTVAFVPETVYDRFAAWQAWPCSAFFARPRTESDGRVLFSYRFYGIIPVVRMQLFSAQRPAHIIHRVLWGFGAGGYHCFLFAPTAEGGKTIVSIFTIYPPQLFLTGLHDQTNRDIFRLLGSG